MNRIQIRPRVWDMVKHYDLLTEMLLADYGVNGKLCCPISHKCEAVDLHHVTPRSKAKRFFICNDGILIHRNSWRNLVPLSHEAHIKYVHGNPSWAKSQGFLS